MQVSRDLQESWQVEVMGYSMGVYSIQCHMEGESPGRPKHDLSTSMNHFYQLVLVKSLDCQNLLDLVVFFSG